MIINIGSQLNLKSIIYKLITNCCYLIYYFFCRHYERIKIFLKKNNYDILIKKLSYENVSNLAIVAITPNTAAKFSIKYLLQALINNGYSIILPCIEKDCNKTWISQEFPNINIVNKPKIGMDFAVWKYTITALLKDPKICANINSLIIANDSIFFTQKTEALINKLKNTKKHWSSLFESFETHYHAQAFCLYFGKELVNSSLFLNFWETYVPYSNKNHAIRNGEIKLSKVLIKSFGLPEVVFNNSKVIKNFLNLTENEIYKLINVLRININFISQLKLHFFYTKKSKEFLSLTNFLDFKEKLQLDHIKKILEFIFYIALEGTSPTHTIGLALNIMFGTPLKKNLAITKFYKIFEIIDNANYYTNDDLKEMEEELKLKQIEYLRYTPLKNLVKILLTGSTFS